MALLSVEAALARVLDGVTPLPAERVPLAEAGGRILAEDLIARRTQPPFDASAMDGYAVRAADAIPDADLTVIGEAAAGHGFAGSVGAGEAVRIFTGAPIPTGADAVLIQENAVRDDDRLRPTAPVRPRLNIRDAGLDFRTGDVGLTAGQRLDYRALSLAAAMNHADLPVRRRPRVAVLATGDELVEPGGALGPDQIIASNAYGIFEIVRAGGGTIRDLGIAPDEPGEIARRSMLAVTDGADILVTLGGASVGDHDLIQSVLGGEGMDLGFWKIAMRPGKPLIFGHLGATRVLGLPGNPVSGLVCALLFLRPLLAALTNDRGLPSLEADAVLAVDVKANDARQDYVRARVDEGRVTPMPIQDSSMLSTFATSNALLIRPPHAPAGKAGDPCRILRLDGVT